MARRSPITIVAVAVVAAMAIGGVLLAVFSAAEVGGIAARGRIALLEIEGIIGDDEQILDQLREFRRDGSVRGYVVAINSPGGVVAPSQSIYAELRRIGEEDSVPVVASIGAVGASGGYYVALAADTIFALAGSMTGSIGVILEVPEASELMDKVGLRMQVVKSAEMKDAGSPFRPLTDADRAVLDAMVQDVYDQFVDTVVDERGLPLASIQELVDGRVLSGRQALESGLIDRIGNLNDALAAAGRMAGLGAHPAIVRPPRDRFPYLDLLFGTRAHGLLDGLVRVAERVAVPSLRYEVAW